MRARANDDKMTGRDWAALAVLVVVGVWILALLGPAIDQQFAFDDARIEAHKASLVSK